MSAYRINPGEMRTQITLQIPTISDDGGGGKQKTYSDVATNPTIWARWINVHGDELTNSNVLTSMQQARVTIRYRADVNETWQVLRDGDAWQIVSVDQIRDQRRFTELLVERAKGTA